MEHKWKVKCEVLDCNNIQENYKLDDLKVCEDCYNKSKEIDNGK